MSLGGTVSTSFSRVSDYRSTAWSFLVSFLAWKYSLVSDVFLVLFCSISACPGWPSVRASVGGLGGYSGAVVCRVLVLVFVLPIWRTWFMHLGGVFVLGGGAVPFCWGCVTKAVVKSVTL